jgi:hypothetical protein
MKKPLFLLLASVSVLLLVVLVQALVFAKPDSLLWQYRLAMGICFIVATRVTVRAYHRSRIRHS